MKEEHLVYKYILEGCRNNWVNLGDLEIRKQDLIEIFEKKHPDIEDIDLILDDMEMDQLIELNEDKIRLTIPFKIITENLRMCKSKSAALSYLSPYFNDSGEKCLKFLETVGILSINGDELYVPFSHKEEMYNLLLDELLTYIDKQDALQIKYGIYDTKLTGIDIFLDLRLQNDPYFLKLEFGLRDLVNKKFLLPLRISDDILQWEFRSRIGETVRLIEKLRQRFKQHSIRESKSLTRSVKLEVVDRKYPRRDIYIGDPIYEMSNLVLESKIINQVGKLDEIKSDFIEALIDKELGNNFEYVSNYQNRSFIKIFTHLVNKERRKKGLILTAGTGMGKTLSYIIPLLYYCLLVNPHHQGTKAINVYPRIKLAENQIEGFVKLIYAINKRHSERKITIGIDYTGTPYSRSDFNKEPIRRGSKKYLGTNNLNRLWEYDETKKAYICPYAKCPVCGNNLVLPKGVDYSKEVPLTCASCSESIDFILYTKDDIGSTPPDILIITTEMLSRGLSSVSYQHLFGTEKFCFPKLIMIDEVHLHTSLQGSQVAMVIRRLLQRISHGNKQLHNQHGEPIVIGLSATIGQPKTFFSELTGIEERFIDKEGPLDEELEKNGAEYYVFVKPDKGENTAVLSNLLQTSMCVLHNMPKRVTDSGEEHNYKALGFVDSLDLVKRWTHNFRDAEKQALYSLRDPEKINSDPQIRDYFGPRNVDPKKFNCEICKNQVDQECIHFQEGECWWFMRYGNEHSVPAPLNISHKTGSEGNVPDEYDLLVTTSAMEVGFDDPNIMCVIQYQSPINTASFTQRKGRAGRGLKNRPITVAVLNPYKTKDIFYYRNHHKLVDPSFDKPPLNVDNLGIRKIHGFYAALDLIAYNYRNDARELASFPFSGYKYKLSQSDQVQILESFDLDGFKNYLISLYGHIDERKEMKEIFNLFYKFQTEVGKQDGTYNSPSRLLSDDLPESLLTSINLPSIDVCEYNIDNNNYGTDGCNEDKLLKCGKNCKLKKLESKVEINQALGTAAPSNVTYRWGKVAYWIPPLYAKEQYEQQKIEHPNNPLKQINVKNNWIVFSDHSDSEKHNVNVGYKWIPKTLQDFVPNVTEANNLRVIRPDAVRVTKFLTSQQNVSNWVYCLDCDTVYPGVKSNSFKVNHLEENKHSYEAITDKTRSFPVGFYHVKFDEKGLYESERMSHLRKDVDIGSEFALTELFGIFGNLFSGLYFANKDSGEYITATKSIVGLNCHLNTKKNQHDLTFGYTDDDGDIGLGFGMQTDGMYLTLPRSIFENLIPSICKQDKELSKNLLRNIFKFEIFKENYEINGKNSFSLDAFSDIYLYFIAKEKIDSKKIEKYCSSDCKDEQVQQMFLRSVKQFELLNDKTRNGVHELFLDKAFMPKVRDIHFNILERHDPETIHKRIDDTFLHSLKHALKSSCIVLGGFESERDIGGWTYLSYDYDFGKRIFIFEQGMFGTGAFRSIYHKFREEPQKLWNFFESYLDYCPTASEEELLCEFLKLGDDELKSIASLFESVFQTKMFSERLEMLKNLKTHLQQNYSLECRDEDINSLMRIFSGPLKIEGETVENWKLFKELNIVLYESLKKIYGRVPTNIELQEVCYTSVQNSATSGDNIPTWLKFSAILAKQIDSVYAGCVQRMSTYLEKVPELKEYLYKVTKQELETIYELTDDEILYNIGEKLGFFKGDTKLEKVPENVSKKLKKIMENIFSDIQGVPLYPYYLALSKQEDIAKEWVEKLKNALAKDALIEEIEKRLLNTCTDGCPACLYTSCDIDGDPKRNKLLLSRKLLKSVLQNLKEDYCVSGENIEKEELLEKTIHKFNSCYQMYITYSHSDAKNVAWVISQLLAKTYTRDGHVYGYFVNSSGYRDIDLEHRRVLYEVCLRCRRLKMWEGLLA